MTAEFVHLHSHGQYSMLDGFAGTKALVEAVKGGGMNAVALTDHGNLYGAIEFYKECRAHDVNPIVGCEMYYVPDASVRGGKMGDYSHMLLLAKDFEGYQNLVKLVTRANVEGFHYKPRVDRAMLEQHSRGLIATSGCLAGEIPGLLLEGKYDEAKQAAGWYRDVFGEGNYYLEIQDHNSPDNAQTLLNQSLYRLHRETDLPLVATNDLHYVHKHDATPHDMLLCMQMGKSLDDPNRMKFDGDEYYVKSPAEMDALFSHVPSALRNTLVIAEKCHLELPFGRNLIPEFSAPAGFASDADYLYSLCEKGLRWRYGDITDAIRTRLDYEFGIIRDKGFVPYFLIVWDYVRYARERGMRCVARGSVAGSIVAYALGMANVDPLRYGIAFERFLNPERNAMPDIDMDFPDDRREEVIQYMAQKYGWDRVAQLVTFNVMAAKSSIRDVGRVLNKRSEADRLARLIPDGPRISISNAVNSVPELQRLYTSDHTSTQIIDMARSLEGSVRNTGIHAAGIVISREPLDTIVPLQRRKPNDPSSWLVTQYEQSYLEELGLLKMDCLGLSNLSILQRTVALIKEARGIDIDIDALPVDDKATFELLARGDTTGVFQLESGSMRGYIRELQPTRLEDIMAMVALYRPGPMNSIPDYIRAKHRPELTTYLHPKLEPILKSTYGVITYQDQVLQVAIQLAGFSWGDVDKFRKALGKKIVVEITRYRGKFINGCIKNGINQELAEEIYSLIEPFGNYGFNAAHAAAYGLVAYQSAYFKAHYPAEFFAATLTTEAGDAKKVPLILWNCRALGIRVLSPDVNKSKREFTVEKQADGSYAVRFGLLAVKGAGDKAVASILTARGERGEFHSLADMFAKCEKLNIGVMGAFIKAGAMDSFGRRAQLIAALEDSAKRGRAWRKRAGDGWPQDILADVPEMTKKELVNNEFETLGFYLSSHPLAEIADQLRERATHFVAELGESDHKDVITLAGRVMSVNKVKTKSGKTMCRARFEDLQGALDVVVFPSVYEDTASLWKTNAIVVMTGRFDWQDGEPQLICMEVEKFGSERKKAETIKKDVWSIHLEGGAKLGRSLGLVRQLDALMQQYPGDDEYEIIVDGPKPMPMSTGKRAKRCAEIEGKILALAGAPVTTK